MGRALLRIHHYPEALGIRPTHTPKCPPGTTWIRLLPQWMTEQTIDAMDIDWREFAAQEKPRIDRWKAEVYGAR